MKNYFLISSFLVLFFPPNSEMKLKVFPESNSVELEQEKNSLIIHGKIVDNLGDSFKYAKVKILNSKQKIKVNEIGNYKINVFEILNEKNELIIEYSFLGFKTEKRKITKKIFDKNNKLEMNIQLKEDTIVIECPNGK